jgi:ribonucleoside-diphosphate reductase alpha chain
MDAVQKNLKFALRSPKDGEVIEEVDARSLWIEILTMRLETGEPYIIFIDTVNRLRPDIYKKLNLKVKTSNLCSEIMLATGKDHLCQERTAVCCLSSLNLEYYDEWKNDENFIYDMFCFIDNVLEDFIQRAGDPMSKAKYSAMRERSVGIGVMGFAGYLQSKMISIDSEDAKKINEEIFSKIRCEADLASKKLAKIKGACPDSIEAGGEPERFTHKLAIAPTASISIIAGNSSPGIEPFVANAYTQKTLAGSLSIRNKFLKNLLEKYNKDDDETWSDIIIHEGSVQHLDFLTEEEKSVFKTAYEIDQKVLIDLAAQRTKYICQAQSLNIFILANINKKALHDLHMYAWRSGVKSLYYCRSRSIQRSDQVSKNNFLKKDDVENSNKSCNISGEDCESCQ